MKWTKTHDLIVAFSGLAISWAFIGLTPTGPARAAGPGVTITQSTNCPNGAAHCVTLSWTDSTSQAGCSSSSTPPCSFGYNILRGTVPSGESSTPLNSSPVAGPPFTDATIVLGASPLTYYYVVEAVETVGGVVDPSAPSNEVSQAFPGMPQPATGAGLSNVH